MPQKNRISNYLKEAPPQAKCVVVSDIINHRVILSYNGAKFLWKWENGLMCPGATSPVNIEPLAAEALIVEELMAFIRMEGVKDNEIIYVAPDGTATDGLIINPPEISPVTFEKVLAKEKIKDLYERFVSNEDAISEEMIGEAISFGVLSPFLSLINL